MAELNSEDVRTYSNFMRNDADMFGELLGRIQDKIQKTDTHLRKALPADLKLAVTLRYLSTGNTYKEMMYQFCVPQNTISIFISEVCNALMDELQDESMPKVGSSELYWRQIAYDFLNCWNLANCLGAIDG